MPVELWEEPVTALPGVGPARAACLARLGLTDVGQLLLYPPRRHLDLRHMARVADLREGRPVTVAGRVGPLQWRPSASDPRLWIGRALLTDSYGDRLELVWFARASAGRRRPSRFPVQAVSGRWVAASGQPERVPTGGWRMRQPVLEVMAEPAPQTGNKSAETLHLHTGRLVPEYPLTAGLTQRVMRRLVYVALTRAQGRVPDPLPAELRAELHLPSKEEALRWLHFPDDPERWRRARRRLAFEELLLLRLASGILRRRARPATGWPLGPPGPRVARWLEQLPFVPTAAQRRAMAEIEADLARPEPMQRLLQGDVGSGKTVVAAYGLLRAAEQGLQAALLAPSDILAQQHAATLRGWFEPLSVPVRLLRGATTRSEREALLADLARGEPVVVVGTHALLQPDVAFANLAVLVVDEQHRFGVRQRAALAARPRPPHLLVVSATPIPRTLALCLYGDLDLSVLGELPPGRLPVDTRWVRPARRDEVYRFLRREAEAGRQGYVVFPAIGDDGGDEDDGVLAAARRLIEGPLAGLPVGVVHGRMPPGQQAEIMARFRAGQVKVLLATTVVEVGVNVPNASVMVIESADRFGLAQLHQLRGRVGRSHHQGYCFLIADPTTPAARRRLQLMRTVRDGFALAQADLELRGPGELLGERQAGLPDLSPLAWPHDAELLAAVERWATRLLEETVKAAGLAGPAGGTPPAAPLLVQQPHQELWRAVARRFGAAMGSLGGLGA